MSGLDLVRQDIAAKAARNFPLRHFPASLALTGNLLPITDGGMAEERA
jgi:hypothetical protein